MSQAQAAQQAVSQALSHVETGIHHPPQNQPVEFNHAINYVNKIKVSYTITQQFLESLYKFSFTESIPRSTRKIQTFPRNSPHISEGTKNSKRRTPPH